MDRLYRFEPCLSQLIFRMSRVINNRKTKETRTVCFRVKAHSPHIGLTYRWRTRWGRLRKGISRGRRWRIISGIKLPTLRLRGSFLCRIRHSTPVGWLLLWRGFCSLSRRDRVANGSNAFLHRCVCILDAHILGPVWSVLLSCKLYRARSSQQHGT
jgi:hypothetical protein